jgi:phenylalanyl-tRNA synthetase beta chain
MIISLNWLKKFTDIDMPVDELATLIGARLVEIEKIIDLGKKYQDALIVKVISAEKLEGSDHLSVIEIDDGGIVTDLERDQNGLVQVVCGAPNIKAGQFVVWLPPESIVPETFDKAEPFKLGIRNLRGTISNGMIASSRELGLSDEHEGILELIDDNLKPGTSFADTFELDDYLLDIENKSLTHRPDCFGIIGFAREVAAISGKTFKTPDWLMDLSNNFGADKIEVELNAIIDDPELCPRYSAIVMSDADGRRKSPLQIQTYLSRVGVRPINAVVDVTNYLMLLTGQPLHAFDYDKLIKLNDGKAEIHVRAGRNAEKLDLLDGRTIELTPEDIVISSGDVAIGLAGAMGGANTIIDDNTQKIIIESATFNLYKLRSTQMRHGIFSEAITRFTKGQPAELSIPVLSSAVNLMSKWAGAQPLSDVVDVYPGKIGKTSITISRGQINETLGTGTSMSQIVKTLSDVEFGISSELDDSATFEVPYWRSDIHINEDIIEEVGRLSGFDNISPTLPLRDFTATTPSEFDIFRSRVRKLLVRAGANEVLTYSFIHGDVLQKVGQKVDNSYRIVNSISPDLQYYRQTLTPSLLGLVHANIRQGYDNFALFEVNRSHQKKDGMTDENVPVEADMLSMVIANKNTKAGAPYYHAKRLFDYLCEFFGLDLQYNAINDGDSDSLLAPFEYRHSAQITDKKLGLSIGVVGEYKKSVAKNFKLPEYIAGFEINLRSLFEVVKNVDSSYTPISRYPGSERDICFQVSKNTSYDQVFSALEAGLQNIDIETNLSPIDIYQPDDAETKNITIRLRLASHSHTLTGDEVSSVIEALILSVAEKTDATVI